MASVLTSDAVVVLGAALAGVGACACLTAGWTLLRIRAAGRARAGRRADAIVIFGAEATPNGPSAELAARLRHGAELYHEGWAPVVLCCGGHSGAISEAESMAAFLRASGVDGSDVMVDESCASTRLALGAAARHGAGRWSSVLVVSAPYHMHRIMREARRHAISALPAPTGPTPVMRRFGPRARQTLREVAAVWWYACTSRRAARSRAGARGAAQSSNAATRA